MSSDTKSDLSVVLILGIFLKKIPLSLLQPFLAKSLQVVQEKHPRIFERLSSEEFDFIIDAIDLPFVFYLKPSQTSPILKAIKRGENLQASATIKGTLSNLLQLFEGSADGDAMFFSKELVIEGSTAATVALRNAIDGEDMDIINDLSEIFSPFEDITKKIANKTIKKYNFLQTNLNKITSSVLSRANKDISSLKNRLYDMEEELDNLKISINKIKKEEIRKKSDYNNP
ncbi:MAG: SCP2 sterol-binding domain-containing protein [Alphaproteobacteria bacterium]|jgi:predicted lipid carrier protein YhbT|nr:SCP2 sterol-binding domain-containing protein [Alphaproteobacteria bacterium]